MNHAAESGCELRSEESILISSGCIGCARGLHTYEFMRRGDQTSDTMEVAERKASKDLPMELEEAQKWDQLSTPPIIAAKKTRT